jgi:uncharacterized protein (DUF2252 family)
MASDLAGTATTNLMVQASGDAHVSNFGWYGSPERELVFDTNDFDETLPASFEWDLKRLATSFAIAAADNGFDERDREECSLDCVRAYRDAMAQFAAQGLLDVWYAHISADRLLERLDEAGMKKRAKVASKEVDKAKRKDSRHVLSKLAEKVDGRYRIIDDRPWVVPLRSMADVYDPSRARSLIDDHFQQYISTLPDHVAVIARRFTPIDMALKVVGVGSVGTRCFILLLEGRDEEDPLFLQVKEAGTSVLEDHFPASAYDHRGRRVVEGQRLMQTNSDIFLGWLTSERGYHYYVRQLKDMKASVDVADLDPEELRAYARVCAWALAQSHARSGDAVMLSGYMGSRDVFAEAVTEFALAYANQNDADHAAFVAATKDSTPAAG